MPEATLRKRNAAPLSRSRDPLHDVSLANPAIEDNDNTQPQQPEQRMLELPAAVWAVMIACYAVFLLALLGATGGGRATFAIAISAIFVTMFFGTARAMLRQAPPQTPGTLDRPRAVLKTAYGPLARGEVYGQVLIVPIAVASFGISIGIISAVVM